MDIYNIYIPNALDPTAHQNAHVHTHTGSDIMLEMYQSGELLEAIEIAAAS